MSVEIIDRTSSKKVKVSNGGALLSALGPSYIGTAGGHYRMSLRTNLATIISAITATGDVGQIGQFNWGSTTKTCLVDRIEIGLTPVTNATAFQRITLGVRKISALTATASGGTTTASLATVAILTTDSGKLRAGYPTTALTDFRLTDTADLTCGAGTRALDVQDFLSLNTTVSTVAAAPEAAKERRSAVWEAKGDPLILTSQTGLSLMNHILWGAAFTGVVDMAVQWREMLNADVPAV